MKTNLKASMCVSQTFSPRSCWQEEVMQGSRLRQGSWPEPRSTPGGSSTMAPTTQVISSTLWDFRIKILASTHSLRKQKYAEKSVELILLLFRLGSCCRGGEKTFVGRSDRRWTVFGRPGHAGRVSFVSGSSCLATSTERSPSCPATVQSSPDRR